MTVDTSPTAIAAMHARLSQAITTASNDDQSVARTKSRERHAARLDTIQAAGELIDALVDERDDALRKHYEAIQAFARAKEAWVAERDGLRAGLDAEAMREAAAQSVEKLAAELNRKECCGRGSSNHPEEPPECCGEPVFMISSEEAAAAIRAIRTGEPR